VSERDGQWAKASLMLTFVVAFNLAPFASSAPTTSKLQEIEAMCSGVHPSCGAGEHCGQHVPPPFSRVPPACVHPQTPHVALRPGPACLLSSAARQPIAPDARTHTCTLPDARYAHTQVHPYTHARTHTNTYAYPHSTANSRSLSLSTQIPHAPDST
jgi:hypothetical protein